MTLTKSGPLLLRRGERNLTYQNLEISSIDGHAVTGESGLDDEITFINCMIIGVGGNGVDFGGAMRFKAINCKFRNEYGPNGGQLGRAFHLYKPRNVVMINCEWDHGSGVYLQETDDSGYAENILIQNCKASNSTKVQKDGSLGQHCQFLQMSHINSFGNDVDGKGYKSVLIDTFQGINPFGGQIEDGISITECHGTAERPILFDNLFIRGIYALNAKKTDRGFSGSGLTIEKHSSYVIVKHLQAVDCMNACFNIAGGHHNEITLSRGICASLQGDKSEQYWAACSMYNSDGTPNELFATNKIEDNELAYNSNRQLGHYFPETGKHSRCNIMYDRKLGNVRDNWMDYPEIKNTYLKGPITAETEEAEYTTWKASLAARGLYVGATPDIEQVNYNEQTDSAIHTLQFLNKAGKEVAIKPESLGFDVQDSSIAQIISGTEAKYFSIKAVKAGETMVTISARSLKNVLITKPFKVIVIKKAEVETPSDDTELFEIKVIWGV